MEHSAEMLRCLVECDIAGARALWAHIAPHAPAPSSDEEALLALHYARTACKRLHIKARAYSHHWLTERGLPSGLPPELRSKAERYKPRIVDAYGIAVHSSFPEVKQIIQDAMCDAVRDCYASGHREPEIVVPIMMERRARARKKLYGMLSEAAGRELQARIPKKGA